MITRFVALLDIYVVLVLNGFQEIFKRRLEAFYKSTAPLLSYYASAEGLASPKVVTLRGKTSDEMWPQLDTILSNEFRLKHKRSAGVHEAVIRSLEGEVTRGSLDGAKL
jgi:nucleoside-triphosphate--adenylate kinase